MSILESLVKTLGSGEFVDVVDHGQMFIDKVRESKDLSKKPIINNLLQKLNGPKKPLVLLRILCQVVAVYGMGTQQDINELFKAMDEVVRQEIVINRQKRNELKKINDGEEDKEKEFEGFLRKLSEEYERFLMMFGYAKKQFQETCKSDPDNPSLRAIRYAISDVLIDYNNKVSGLIKKYCLSAPAGESQTFDDVLNSVLGFDVNLNDLKVDNYQEFRKTEEYKKFQHELMQIYKENKLKNIEELVEDTGLMRHFEVLDNFEVALELGMKKEIDEALEFFSKDSNLDDAVRLLIPGTY